MSATIQPQPSCSSVCPRRGEYRQTGAMTPIGSAMRLSRRASSTAFRSGNADPCTSDTTSADTNNATVSKSCSVASRIGATYPPDTNAASKYPLRHHARRHRALLAVINECQSSTDYRMIAAGNWAEVLARQQSMGCATLASYRQLLSQ